MMGGDKSIPPLPLPFLRQALHLKLRFRQHLNLAWALLQLSLPWTSNFVSSALQEMSLLERAPQPSAPRRVVWVMAVSLEVPASLLAEIWAVMVMEC